MPPRPRAAGSLIGSVDGFFHRFLPSVAGSISTPRLQLFGSLKRLSDRKNVTDRLTAVRETGVSRYQGGPIEGPPETPRTSQHYHIEGINYVKENGNKYLSV